MYSKCPESVGATTDELSSIVATRNREGYGKGVVEVVGVWSVYASVMHVYSEW